MHGSKKVGRLRHAFAGDLPKQAGIVFGRYFRFLRKRNGERKKKNRNSGQVSHRMDAVY
jgi:hypothetical protein